MPPNIKMLVQRICKERKFETVTPTPIKKEEVEEVEPLSRNNLPLKKSATSSRNDLSMFRRVQSQLDKSYADSYDGSPS